MSNPEQKIQLKSSDGVTFLIDKNVAMQSVMLYHVIDDGFSDSIPVTNVTGATLARVIEYCERHVNVPDEYDVIEKEDMEAFDKAFVDVDQDMLFDLMLAANYMEVKGLLDLLCKTVADMMKGKKAEEIRKMFNIKNDYTEEQEDAIRMEHPWAFE